MNKKSVFAFVSTAIAFCLACTGAGSQTAANAEEKTVEAIRYNSYEAIVAGEPISSQAEVQFSDGTTEMRPIRYRELPVDKMHDLFYDFNAVGYVEGSDEEIRQTFVVLPANVEYLINLGSNLTDTDYEYSGEGVLGKVLDPTGESSVSDPYNAAILKKFPEMRNKVGSKQYGQGSPADVGDWGYVGDQLTTYKVNGSVTETGRNLFTHMTFPMRGTTNIEVRFSLPEESANYDLYLGFYSYWFARNIGIKLNNQTLEGDYEYSVKPSAEVYPVQNVPMSGEQSVKFTGKTLYEEALAAFVCVTKADTQEYDPIPAPTAPDALDLADTQMEVSDLTPGTVLQIYDYDKRNLLFEHLVAAEETSFSVPLTQLDLEGVARLGVCCSNAKEMGEETIVKRTDVEGFTVSYETDFVGHDLSVVLSARAPSGIVSLKVYRGGTLLTEREESGAAVWSDTVSLSENGDYRFEIESGSGGKGIEERTISNIDTAAPSIGLKFDMTTAKASGSNELVLGVTPVSVATVLEAGYIFCGEQKEADLSGGQMSFTESGSYTLYFVNSLGKMGACKLNIAMDRAEAVTAEITEDTSKRFKQLNFTGKNGYEIVSVNVYGNIGDETEKMIVNGSDGRFGFSVYRDGVYFTEIVTSDGAREYVVLNTSEEKPTGGNTAVIALAVTLGVIVAAGTAAVILLAVRRKKTVTSDVSETSDPSEKK